MKKVLFVAYHFPPEGGPGVQRILKFIKYLPEFGYKPFVLTAAHPVKTKDTSLADDLPDDLQIVRTTDFVAYLPGDLRRMFTKRRSMPDKHSLWRLTSLKAGIRLVKEEAIDLIFSSSPPHSVHVLSRRIAEATGKPLVVDFRDEWTFDPTFRKKSKKQEDALRLEKEILTFSKAVTTVTRKAKDNFASQVPGKKVYYLPNGFDPEDFRELDTGNVKRKPDRKLVITYCGRFTPKSSPDAFFKALDMLVQSGMTLKNKVHIRVIGNPGNSRWLEPYPYLQPLITFLPYLPHKECLQEMADADVLLLLATNTRESEVFTGKVFEYFYFRKPIFASLVYPGELSDMLKAYGNAYIAIEKRDGHVESVLKEMLRNADQHSLQLKDADTTFIGKFDRRLQTKELSAIFESLTRIRG